MFNFKTTEGNSQNRWNIYSNDDDEDNADDYDNDEDYYDDDHTDNADETDHVDHGTSADRRWTGHRQIVHFKDEP